MAFPRIRRRLATHGHVTPRERRALRLSAGTLLLIVAAVGLALLTGALISEHLTPEAWRIRSEMAETRDKLEEARAEAEQARLEEQERDELIARLFDELEAIRAELERVRVEVQALPTRDPPDHHHDDTVTTTDPAPPSSDPEPATPPPAPGRSGTAPGRDTSTAKAQQQQDPRPGNTPDHASRKPDAGPPDHAERKGKP